MYCKAINHRIGEIRVALIVAALAICFPVSVCVAGDANLAAGRRLELSGAIKDALARPIAAAEVRLEESGRVIARSRTDSAGAFQFKALAPGVFSPSYGPRRTLYAGIKIPLAPMLEGPP